MQPSHARGSRSRVRHLPHKFWDKIGALQTMARHLGLFEKDNSRQQPPVLVKVPTSGSACRDRIAALAAGGTEGAECGSVWKKDPVGG